MSTPDRASRGRAWKYLFAITLAGALVLAALGWYATTDSFQGMVRRRLVQELEAVTGGRVELGSVHTVPFQFQVEARDLTIHGRENKADVLYVHVDRLVARLRFSSVLSLGLGFQSIVFEHPVIHLVVYPDGTTNQPMPNVSRRAITAPVQKLFSLSVSEVEVRRGELVWKDQQIPFDFTANDVSADMSYSFLRGRYDGRLLLGKVLTTVKDFRPVAWTGAIHFRLHENSLEIRSLQASTGKSHLDASGTVINFLQPKFSGNYDLVVDLESASAIARMNNIQRGTAEAKGIGSWGPDDLSFVGKLHVQDLDWRGASFTLRNSNLDTGFSVDSKRISMPDIVAKVFGGAVAGSAEIKDWQTLAKADRGGKTRNANLQYGVVHLKLRDISGAELASSLSTPRRPFSRLNVAGNISGAVEAQWRGSTHNSITDVVLDVAPPTIARPGQLIVHGHTHAIYRSASGELEIAEFNAATHATQIRASGTLSSSVKLSIETTNLGEWQPILIASGYDEPIPVTLRGPASFVGTANGRLSSITFAGKLQSGNFDFVIPVTARTPEEDIHWDSVATDLRLSPAGLSLRNGMLRRNGTTIGFDVNLGLADRKFLPDSPFTARVNMTGANLAETLSMAGYNYPASGDLNLSLQLWGTRSEPEGTGRVEISKAMFQGRAIQQFNSDLSFSKGEVTVRNIEATQAQAHVTGQASYRFATHEFTCDLTGTHFDLARMPAIQFSRVAVSGGLDFVARASGTLEHPTIKGTIRLRDLALDHEMAGDFALTAVSEGPDLKVSGISQFKTADLKLEGSVHPGGDWPADINLHFHQLGIDSILKAYLHSHVTGPSAVAGDLHVQGPLRRPHDLNVAGNLSEFSANIEQVQVRNQDPVRFDLSNNTFRIDQFHLLGDNTDLSAGGSVQLSGERRLDIRARGQLNLRLVETYNANFPSTGTVNVDLTVAGTTSNPIAHGRLQVSNASIAYSDSLSSLSELNGTLVFEQNRFEVETLTGRVGGGLLALRGHASLSNGQVSFDLGLHGEGVRIRYPTGVSSTANMDLQFSGNTATSTLSGDVTVTKVAITPGFDFGAYLQRTAQSSALSQTDPLLNGIRLDVHIVTTPDLQMQTAVIRLSGDADFRLRGTAAKSVLLGRADVLEGQAYFNGTKYRLERGDVTFTNPVSTNPVVDLQATTQVRDYEITLNLNGPVDKLNLTYRSDPPLPPSDIIALLAFGQTSQQSTQLQRAGASSFNQEASNAILAAAMSATVSNRVQRLFGVSRIKIDPQGLSTETSPTQTGPAITIDQQVASNITLTYSTNVSQTSQQVIQGEYNVTRNISVVAIRDQNGVVSFEVRVRQRKN